MDFTREPIIETIITPKEGYKLVVRSSTNASQEEYFVDAVEIVAFGNALFFRSLERPKAFLVPVSDYEVLEVREARVVLKNAGLDRSIKIGGGKEGAFRAPREAEKETMPIDEGIDSEQVPVEIEPPVGAEGRSEKVDKKRDRRRHYRKKRGREEKEGAPKEEGVEPTIPPLEDGKVAIPAPEQPVHQEGAAPLTPAQFSSLLQPPPTLISETINRYRQNEMFKGAFYLTEEEQYKPHDKVQELLSEEDEEEEAPPLKEPSFAPEASESQEKEEERSPEEHSPFLYEAEEQDEIREVLPFYTGDEEETTGIIETPYSTLADEEPIEENPRNDK